MAKKKKSKYTEVVGKRSVFGHIAKWLFWGFNALMVIWIWEQIELGLIGDTKLIRIRLRETPTIYTDYYGPNSE